MECLVNETKRRAISVVMNQPALGANSEYKLGDKCLKVFQRHGMLSIGMTCSFVCGLHAQISVANKVFIDCQRKNFQTSEARHPTMQRRMDPQYTVRHIDANRIPVNECNRHEWYRPKALRVRDL